MLDVRDQDMFHTFMYMICPCFQGRRRNAVDDVDPLRSSSDRLRVSHLQLPQSPGTPYRVPLSPSIYAVPSQNSNTAPLNLRLSQVLKITQNFSPTLVIGQGAFGTVYKAELPGGQVVAIKRAKREHFASLRAEFSNEVALLMKIEHKNLVHLLGYIDEGNEHLIISEYVSNGTLREHLDCQRGNALDFSQRLEIAIDIAHGLTYLHLYAEKPIIHRDVKSSNILLTDGLRAKVADFGFARIGPLDPDHSQVETDVRGTVGYLDPEYLRSNHLTLKSDVFSYGILLLEILSARRPVEMSRTRERITVRWAFDKYNNGQVIDILDPAIQGYIPGEILNKLFDLVFQCVAPSRKDRPPMKEVVERLWKIRKEYARMQRSVLNDHL